MINEILNEYFLQPIRVESGYNLVNSITYAVIMIGVLYLIFKILKKGKVQIDFRFLLVAVPYAMSASFLRVMVDSGIIKRSFWTVSPGIYLLFTSIFLLVLVVGTLLKNKKIVKEWKAACLIFGFILFLSEIVMFLEKIKLENVGLSLKIVLVTLGFILLSYFIFSHLKWDWISNKFGLSAFSAHLFDSITTSMVIFFVGGWEKHPLPRYFINKFGAFGFVPLKMVVIIPAIYLISKELRNKELTNFLLMSITLLGLGEATRNFFNLIII